MEINVIVQLKKIGKVFILDPGAHLRGHVLVVLELSVVPHDLHQQMSNGL